MILFVVLAEQKLGNLIPDQPLIYERANGVVFARYRDKPEIPRWIIGGEPGAVAQANGQFVSDNEFRDICKLSLTNATIKEILDQLIVVYTLVKEDK